HQTMRSGIALGYVQGADWAADLNAVGKVLGLNSDFTSFVTMGPQGLNVRSGRFSLTDSERGWGLEAGQLFTDLRGLARGVRGSWRLANNQSSLSFYRRDSHHDATVSFGDELRHSHHVVVGAEVASDG